MDPILESLAKDAGISIEPTSNSNSVFSDLAVDAGIGVPVQEQSVAHTNLTAQAATESPSAARVGLLEGAGIVGQQFAYGFQDDLPRMLGDAMKYVSEPGGYFYDTGKRITDWVDEQEKNNPDLLKKYKFSENPVLHVLAGGARMIPQSLGPPVALAGLTAGVIALLPEAAAAAVTAGIGATIVGTSVAVAGAVPAGLSQGQQTYDKLVAAGVDDETARSSSRLSSLIEWGGESVENMFAVAKWAAKLAGVGIKTTRIGGKDAVEYLAKLAEPSTWSTTAGKTIADVAKTMAWETGTEVGQQVGETAIENRAIVGAGGQAESLIEAAKSVVGPTIGMTLIMTPLGIHANVREINRQNTIKKALLDPTVHPEYRSAAALSIAKDLYKLNPEAGANFSINSSTAITLGQPMPLSEEAVEDPAKFHEQAFTRYQSRSATISDTVAALAEAAGKKTEPAAAQPKTPAIEKPAEAAPTEAVPEKTPTERIAETFDLPTTDGIVVSRGMIFTPKLPKDKMDALKAKVESLPGWRWENETVNIAGQNVEFSVTIRPPSSFFEETAPEAKIAPTQAAGQPVARQTAPAPTVTPPVPSTPENKAAALVAPAGRFQHARNSLTGENTGRQTEIHALTEPLFQWYLRPVLGNAAQSLVEYRQKFPGNDHIALTRTAPNAEWLASGVGPQAELSGALTKIQAARPVPSFDSPEAMKQALTRAPSLVQEGNGVIRINGKLTDLESKFTGIDPAKTPAVWQTSEGTFVAAPKVEKRPVAPGESVYLGRLSDKVGAGKIERLFAWDGTKWVWQGLKGATFTREELRQKATIFAAANAQAIVRPVPKVEAKPKTALQPVRTAAERMTREQVQARIDAIKAALRFKEGEKVTYTTTLRHGAEEHKGIIAGIDVMPDLRTVNVWIAGLAKPITEDMVKHVSRESLNERKTEQKTTEPVEEPVKKPTPKPRVPALKPLTKTELGQIDKLPAEKEPDIQPPAAEAPVELEQPVLPPPAPTEKQAPIDAGPRAAVNRETGAGASISIEQRIKDNLGLAYSIADRYTIPNMTQDEVRAEAAAALTKAGNKFDPARGDFASFVGATVRNHLNEVYNSELWEASHAGVSLNEQIENDEESESRLARVPDNTALPADQQSLVATIQADLNTAISELPAHERVVVEGILSGKTQDAIAEDLGLSPAAITKRKVSLLKNLRTKLEAKGYDRADILDAFRPPGDVADQIEMARANKRDTHELMKTEMPTGNRVNARSEEPTSTPRVGISEIRVNNLLRNIKRENGQYFIPPTQEEPNLSLNGHTSERPAPAAAKVETLIRNWISKKANVPETIVIQSVEDIGDYGLSGQTLRMLRENQPRGFYDGASNRIFVVADQLQTPEEAIEVVMHEAIGHYGIESILGPTFHTDMLALSREIPEADLRETAELYKDTLPDQGLADPLSSNRNRVYAAKEYIAKQAETEPTLWRKFVEIVRRALSKILPVSYVNRLFKEGKIEGLIRTSQEFVERGQTPTKTSSEKSSMSMTQNPEIILGRQIQTDESMFAEQINRILYDDKYNSDASILVTQTPEVLQKLGAKPLRILAAKSVLNKVTGTWMSGQKHGIQIADIQTLPRNLHDPIAVFDSESDNVKDALVIMTELVDNDGDSVIVAIHLSKKIGFKAGGQYEINKIASIYGKDRDEWFLEQVAKGNLRYLNKEKAVEWNRSRGVSFPKEEAIQRLSKNKVLYDSDIVKPNFGNISMSKVTWGKETNGYRRTNPATTPEAIAFFRSVESQYEPSYVPNAVTRQVAGDELKARGAKAVITEIASGKIGTQAKDIALFKEVTATPEMTALITGTDQQKNVAIAAGFTYHEQLTRTARALQIARNDLETPEQRRAAIIQMLTTPPDAVRTRLAGMNPVERRRVIEEQRLRMSKAIEALKRLGIEDLNTIAPEKLMDNQGFMKIVQQINASMSSKTDRVYEYWRNAILSGIQTNLTNLGGNWGFGTWELFAQRPAEALVNMIANAPGAPTFESIKAAYRLIGPSITRANAAFSKAFITEVAESGKIDTVGSIAIPGVKGRIVRLPQRLLLAVDEWFKTVYVSSLAADYATRQADQAKLVGRDREEYVKWAAGTTDTLAHQQAYDETLRLLWQNKPGEVGSALIQLRNAKGMTGLLFKFIFPFVTTPTNIIKTGILKSPFGTLRMGFEGVKAALGKNNRYTERPDLMLRDTVEQLFAWSLAGLLYAVTAPGDPDDPEDKDKYPWLTGSVSGSTAEKRFLSKNMPGQSIRIGDKWYSYARIEPLATALTLTIDALNTFRATIHGKPLDKSDAAKLIALVRDKTYLQGLGDLIRGLEDPEQWVDVAQNFSSSWVPNLLKQAVRATDPYVRDYRVRSRGTGWLAESMLVRGAQEALPIAGIQPLPRFDHWGNPISKDAGMSFLGQPLSDIAWRMVMPIRAQTATNFGNIDRMIWNWNRAQTEPDAEWWPGTPNPSITLRGREYRLNNDQYRVYLETRGKLAQRMAERQHWNFNDPTPSDIKRIQVIFERAGQVSRQIMTREIYAQLMKKAS